MIRIIKKKKANQNTNQKRMIFNPIHQSVTTKMV